LKIVFIFLAVTLLVCGVTFAQQTSTTQPDYGSSSSKTDQQSKYEATTGKKFVGKIVSIDHNAKTFTVAAGDMNTGSTSTNGSSATSQGTTDMAQGTKTFKYNDHTKYHPDGGNEKDFRISDLDKGDNVVILYDDSDNAILISKMPASEKTK
jgi:hypothetical protein